MSAPATNSLELKVRQRHHLRGKSAAREVRKSLGFDEGTLTRLLGSSANRNGKREQHDAEAVSEADFDLAHR